MTYTALTSDYFVACELLFFDLQDFQRNLTHIIDNKRRRMEAQVKQAERHRQQASSP